MDTKTAFLSEPRFAQPRDWRWHSFKSSSGHKIRFGSVFPKDKIPDAVIVCLPGFREFSEKYFELAHDMLSRNFGFWIMDWAGQGLSDRYLDDPNKVHSLGVPQHVKDLKQFLFDYVKPAAVHPDVGRLPVIFIGHSMGGHIGLRYLHDNQENFVRAAAFTAPLIRIQQFESYPSFISGIFATCIRLLSKSYIPGGEKMSELLRDVPPGTGLYSSDPVRDQLQKAWMNEVPGLKVKGPTYRWLAEILRSCNVLDKKSYLQKIKTPVLITTAGKDVIVSSQAIVELAKKLPECEIIDLPDARHEILMEQDDIRSLFLSNFDDFMQRHILTKQDRLKKF